MSETPAIAPVPNVAAQADVAAGVIVFTDNAARKVKELMDEEGNPDLKTPRFHLRRRMLRISIRLHL